MSKPKKVYELKEVITDKTGKQIPIYRVRILDPKVIAEMRKKVKEVKL